MFDYPHGEAYNLITVSKGVTFVKNWIWKLKFSQKKQQQQQPPIGPIGKIQWPYFAEPGTVSVDPTIYKSPGLIVCGSIFLFGRACK